MLDTPPEVGQKRYPDLVIQCCLTLGKVTKQPLRQTTGFVKSLLMLMRLSRLPVPNYTTLSRRAKSLRVKSVFQQRKTSRKRNVAGDSTGLKVFGEGEWKVRKHGWDYRRVWRKLHLFVDVDTQEVVFSRLTDCGVDDASVASEFFEESDILVGDFMGDGAYDSFKCRKAAFRAGAKQVVPPRKDAVPDKGGNEHLQERNKAIERIGEVGRKAWKEETGYHRRSLSETAMFRYKSIVGDRMQFRNTESQHTEAMIGVEILNLMNKKMI